jgi:hypothetical protein
VSSSAVAHVLARVSSVGLGGLTPIPTACSLSRGSPHQVSRARFYFNADKQASFANKPLPTTADHTLFGLRGGPSAA